MKTTRFLVLLVVILAAASLYFAFGRIRRAGRPEPGCSHFIAEIQRLESELSELKGRSTGQDGETGMVREFDHPRRDVIVGALRERSDLIPFEGELGGTMGFYGGHSIHILTPSWILAEFDDGHRAGAMLLEYSISNGTVEFTVLDAALM